MNSSFNKKILALFPKAQLINMDETKEKMAIVTPGPVTLKELERLSAIVRTECIQVETTTNEDELGPTESLVTIISSKITFPKS